MTLSIVAPLLAAIAVALAVTTLHRRLPPALASRAVVVTMVVVVSAALPTLWLVGLSYLAHSSLLGSGFEWCAKALGMHAEITPFVGVPALVAGAWGSVRATRAVWTTRRLRRDAPGNVEVAGHHRPFAFTLPGRGGHVVLSSGLIDLLDDDECGVVVAHELAHARHRHDRFLLVANIATATLPPLRPLAARLQFSLERWADEAAAAHCGDRRRVAVILGKVALGHAAPTGALSFNSLGVPGRVAALLRPPVRRPNRALILGMWCAIAATAGLGIVQLHHLAGLAAAMCPH